MRRTVIIYGLCLAALVFLLKYLEYRHFVRDLSLELYLTLVAVLFAGVGIWVGLKLTAKRKLVILAPPDGLFTVDPRILRHLGISDREYEVLKLLAQGHSNKEIADKLFVSVNTIKSHAASLFLKLDVKRRTEAMQRARDLKLLP